MSSPARLTPFELLLPLASTPIRNLYRLWRRRGAELAALDVIESTHKNVVVAITS